MSDIDKLNKVEELINGRAKNKADADKRKLRDEIQGSVGAFDYSHIHGHIKKFLPSGYSEEITRVVIDAILSAKHERSLKRYADDETNKIRDMLAFMDKELD